MSKMKQEEDPEFTSSHRHTKITTIYGDPLYENYLKTRRKDFPN